MIKIYTDGSSTKVDAGYAAVVMNDTNEVINVIHNHCSKATNNQMELAAILAALIEIDKNYTEEQVTIYTDSAYAIGCCTKWCFSWAANGWKRPGDKPIENLKIIKKIYEYVSQPFYFTRVKIEKVGGHQGICGNEIADAAARDVDYIKTMERYGVKFKEV